MAAKTKPKAKGKNHFASATDGVLFRGTIVGVSASDDSVRYDDVQLIELVGDKGVTQYDETKLNVTVTDKGVFFTPSCGDNGVGFTRETFIALFSGVSDAWEYSKE